MIRNNDDNSYDFTKPDVDPRHDDKHFPMVVMGSMAPSRAILADGQWNNCYLNAVAAWLAVNPDPVPAAPVQPPGVEGVDWETNGLGDRVPIKISADRQLLLSIAARLAEIEGMLVTVWRRC